MGLLSCRADEVVGVFPRPGNLFVFAAGAMIAKLYRKGGLDIEGGNSYRR